MKQAAILKHYLLKARQFNIPLGKKTRIMGILNLTLDSFSGDGLITRHRTDPRRVLAYAEKLITEGADILDVGGESSRPGATPISEEEEINRILPSLKLLTQKLKIPISVDTYKTEVAKNALDAGAAFINNIMGSKADRSLLKMVAHYNAAIVIMHIRKTPKNMQKNIRYNHLITDIIAELRNAIEKCLEIGIKSDRIIIDPGIGFGKTVEQNLQLIHQLDQFKVLKKPLLVGTSRKSFIGKILNQDIKNRLIGTLATVCCAIQNGAHIVRVHDVSEASQAAIMVDAINAAEI